MFLCGGKSKAVLNWHLQANLLIFYRISKTMGEAFKIYSEALVGHEDDSGTRTTPSASTPTMSSQGVVEGMELEPVF